MKKIIIFSSIGPLKNASAWVRYSTACLTVLVVSLSTYVIFPGKAAHATNLSIYVSATVDRGPTDSLSSALRLANVPFDAYVNGLLTSSKTTTAQAPGGSTSADTYGTASVGDTVAVCLAGDVPGYSFERIRLNANPVTDPSGLNRPCGGLSSVGSSATAVPISFNI